MSNRRRDQERWEYLFMYILLATRPVQLVGGLILFIYAVVTLLLHPVVSSIALILAAYLFLLVFSDRVALYTARFGGWVATVGKRRN